VEDEAKGNGAATNPDWAVFAYEARSMLPLHRIQAFSGEATCAAISPDGGQLVVVESDHTIRFWELPSGRLLHTVPDEGVVVKDIVYSPDGRFLLAAVGDDLRIWDSQDFALKHDFKQHDNTIERIVVAHDGRFAATVSHDLSVRIWSLIEGRQLRTLTGHTSPPMAAAFSRDGRQLATGASDGTVHIWDVPTGQQLIVLRDTVRQSSITIRDLVFRDEGTLIVAVTDEKPPGLFLAQWRVKSAMDASE
jgi:WD40 repeat protein